MYEFSWHVFGIFLGISLPLSLLIGFSAATIGFTSWLLVTPLLFLGFRFTVYDAVLAAVALDFLNGALLWLLFWRRGLFEWRTALFVSLPSGVACGVALVWARPFLHWFESRLKIGLGPLLLLIGVAFFVKAGLAWRKHKKDVQDEDEEDVLVEENGRSSADEKSALLAPSINAEALAEYGIGGHELPRGGAASRGDEADSFIATWPPSWFPLPADGARRKARLWNIGKVVLATSVGVVSATVSGLIGVGSGLNFVLICILGFGLEVKPATGTGCFVMMLLMAEVLIAFAAGDMPVQLSLTWPYLITILSGGTIGTIVGSMVAARVSAIALNFLVGIVLTLGGVLSLVQIIVFNV